jgi:hypothetical protein
MYKIYSNGPERAASNKGIIDFKYGYFSYRYLVAKQFSFFLFMFDEQKLSLAGMTSDSPPPSPPVVRKITATGQYTVYKQVSEDVFDNLALNLETLEKCFYLFSFLSANTTRSLYYHRR